MTVHLRRRCHPLVATIAVTLAACTGPGPSRPTGQSRTSTPTPSSTTPARSTTSTGQVAPDRLERQHRLAQALPHSTPHYRVDFTVGADGRLRLVVTLLAELNGPQDLGGYQAELRRYKAEALEFIRAQGDDPATYTVTFLPPDPNTNSPKEGT